MAARRKVSRKKGGVAPSATPTHLDLLIADWGFRVPASPLQRAIVLAADAKPIGRTLTDEQCELYFGCDREDLGRVRPSLVCVIAGVRSGKSLIAGAATLKAALGADLSQLLSHEMARAAIVAPTVDNATATFRLLLGAMRSSPMLSQIIVGEPTQDTIVIRRPSDGREVEIVVVAAHRAGVGLRSRWLVSAVLDESAAFGADALGNVVTAEELVRAAAPRLVKGGALWCITTPFGPEGLVYETYRRYFGKPGRVLVVHAPTLAMNPSFDPAQIEEFRERDPDACAREHDAAWIDAVTAFLDGVSIERAVRKGPLELPPGDSFFHAAWDTATRGNSWTLVIARGEHRGGRTEVAVALARQWTGSRKRPLNPEDVIAEIAGILARYRIKHVLGDAYAVDALRPLARPHGLTLRERHTGPEERYELFASLKNALSTGCLQLPPVPALITDLKGVRKKATANAVRIELPRTPDGRHCDYAPSLALAFDAASRSSRRFTAAPSRGPSHQWPDFLSAQQFRMPKPATEPEITIRNGRALVVRHRRQGSGGGGYSVAEDHARSGF